jgi:hypothetical protein
VTKVTVRNKERKKKLVQNSDYLPYYGHQMSLVAIFFFYCRNCSTGILMLQNGPGVICLHFWWNCQNALAKKPCFESGSASNRLLEPDSLLECGKTYQNPNNSILKVSLVYKNMHCNTVSTQLVRILSLASDWC